MTHPFRSCVGLVCVLPFGLIPAECVRGQDAAKPHAEVDFGQLDSQTASAWARLVLKNVDIEFPNMMSLVYVDASQIKTPKQHFPAFYGCFDWHSSVHGHWVLARLLRTMPYLPDRKSGQLSTLI